MMELKGKRVMVVGLGVSGRAAARFLSARGVSLLLTDKKTDLELSDLPAGEVHLGFESAAWLKGVDLVVTSPGIPRDSILLREAVARDIQVIGELELASHFMKAPIVGITGTNGKSTVTTMVGDIMKAAGKRVFVGGNLGTPLIEAADNDVDALVIEISSFQLEWIDKFRAHVGIHLNLSDDHFERYRDLEDYGRAKARLFENQGAGDFAILNRDDPNVWKLHLAMRSRVISFGLGTAPAGGDAMWPDTNVLFFDINGRRGRLDLSQLKIAGRHNLANAMASAAAALAMDIEPRMIEQGLASFKPLSHRIEMVHEAHGIKFVDDSKGTNVGAVIEALAAVPAPVILIAGGVDKGGDYAPLRKPLEEKVKLAIFIGAARDKMRAALDGSTRIEVVEKMAGAVKRAAEVAVTGDTVLLSPACSSFDQFRDYAERGNLFKELVRAL
ncbi:MAG TPA: UDP-N-acetylmuramoyl-L-alanine--D-glutamate ligase [Candidatus Binataceae bacterium]|nr:UDP-N-acetylmuramoyl-L-alanine--D-glutamate ligase [Candidatus Binataceae bacterium]